MNQQKPKWGSVFLGFMLMVLFQGCNLVITGVITAAFLHWVFNITELSWPTILLSGLFVRMLGYGRFLALPQSGPATEQFQTLPNPPLRPVGVLQVDPTLN